MKIFKTARERDLSFLAPWQINDRLKECKREEANLLKIQKRKEGRGESLSLNQFTRLKDLQGRIIPGLLSS